MKVLLINGSQHEKGCTYTALAEVEKALNANGVETEILKADTAFMALKITGSSNTQTIVLRYQTPYLEEGKAVTFIGVGALGCVILGDTAVRLIKKRKMKKEEGSDDHV